MGSPDARSGALSPKKSARPSSQETPEGDENDGVMDRETALYLARTVKFALIPQGYPIANRFPGRTLGLITAAV